MSSGNNPIGHVLYGDAPIRAELFADGSWRVRVVDKEYPTMASTLEQLYRDHYQGPSDGHYGERILADLARRWSGVSVFYGTSPAGPGEIP
jgi:hypothetical protein